MTRNYDGLDRLTQEQTGQGTVTYSYDNASRRSSMTVAGQPAVAYSYDNADRLTGLARGSDSVGFSYDAAGHRIQIGRHPNQNRSELQITHGRTAD